MKGRMRRLLCIIALALLVRSTVSQAFIASAATRRVQQRVEQILASGGKLTPEALLSRSTKSKLASGAAYSDPVAGITSKAQQQQNQDANDAPIYVASIADGASTAAIDAAAVSTAANGLKVKPYVKQQDDSSEAQPSQQKEAAALIRRGGATKLSYQQQQPTAATYIFPGSQLQDVPQLSQDSHMRLAAPHPEVLQKHQAQTISISREVEADRRLIAGNPQRQPQEAVPRQQQQLQQQQQLKPGMPISQAVDEQVLRERRAAAAAAADAERAAQHQGNGRAEPPRQPEANQDEVIRRLSNVDWKSVFEAAQKEAEANERAEEAKQKVAAEARKEAQRRYVEQQKLKQAEAERQQAEAKQQQQQRVDGGVKQDAHIAAAKAEQYNPYEDDMPLTSKLIIQEKSRSPMRYFPGGGIYSFTSELTCLTDKEYKEKLEYKSFPLVTPRMLKITVGVCEWTVAEVAPAQVKQNVFLLGNAWATCTFLPAVQEACAKPLSPGLTLTIQALMYQFAQPKGIKPAEAEEQAGGTAATNNPVTKVDTGKAPSSAGGTKKKSAPYLMEVELQNAFLGLITGAFGPKKSKFKQGALQFAFGPPPDSIDKTYAIETMLPPVQLGGPSVEELQEGVVKLVPGTYQIVFDDE